MRSGWSDGDGCGPRPSRERCRGCAQFPSTVSGLVGRCGSAAHRSQALVVQVHDFALAVVGDPRDRCGIQAPERRRNYRAGLRALVASSCGHTDLDERQQFLLEPQSLFEPTGTQRGGVVQESEPLQGLLAAVMQGQYGSNPCAQGLPDADVGGQFADRVCQDLPEAVLAAAEKILLG